MVDRHHPGKAPTALLQMLSDRSCHTIADIAVTLDLTHRQVSDAAARLLRRGYLERHEVGCYQLTDAGLSAAESGEVITSGPTGPRDKARAVRDSLRQRAWSAMRVRRNFTVPDLVADAANARDANPTDNLQRYLRRLGQAGFVREAPRRAEGTSLTSNGFKCWLLTRDTGPVAPALLSKVDAVHDFNTGEDIPCSRR